MSLESQGHTQIQTHTRCVPSLSLCCSVQRQGFEDALPLSNHTTNLLGYTPMHANPCLPEDSHMQPSHITIISAVNSSYARESFCPWLNTGIYRGGFQQKSTAVFSSLQWERTDCLTCFPWPGPLQQLLHGEQVLGLHRLQQFLVLSHLPRSAALFQHPPIQRRLATRRVRLHPGHEKPPSSHPPSSLA